ncbi:hypothetical protein D9M68_416590 [compost metagenome]
MVPVRQMRRAGCCSRKRPSWGAITAAAIEGGALIVTSPLTPVCPAAAVRSTANDSFSMRAPSAATRSPSPVSR